jgi:hypothetical protein
LVSTEWSDGPLAASHLQGPMTTVVHVWTTSLLWCEQATNAPGKWSPVF